MATNIRYDRTYPNYAYAYTYKVWDGAYLIGYVGHDKGADWRAKVPGLGGELLPSFRTRHDAMCALCHIADGGEPSKVGGFFTNPQGT